MRTWCTLEGVLKNRGKKGPSFQLYSCQSYNLKPATPPRKRRCKPARLYIAVCLVPVLIASQLAIYLQLQQLLLHRACNHRYSLCQPFPSQGLRAPSKVQQPHPYSIMQLARSSFNVIIIPLWYDGRKHKQVHTQILDLIPSILCMRAMILL